MQLCKPNTMPTSTVINVLTETVTSAVTVTFVIVVCYKLKREFTETQFTRTFHRMVLLRTTLMRSFFNVTGSVMMIPMIPMMRKTVSVHLDDDDDHGQEFILDNDND